jgi:hypothetical protein
VTALDLDTFFLYGRGMRARVGGRLLAAVGRRFCGPWPAFFAVALALVAIGGSEPGRAQVPADFPPLPPPPSGPPISYEELHRCRFQLNRDRQKPGGLLTVVAMQCLAGKWRKKRN